MKNLFITVEGGEGSGKSTFSRKLAEHLRKEGWNVIQTREPGGTPEGEVIRERILKKDLSVEKEISLFAKARRLHNDHLIGPALKRDKTIVVCDRYFLSNLVYQGFAQPYPADSMEMVRQVENANKGILVPDLTFFLDIEPEEALKRITQNDRETNRFDRKPLSFHRSVYQGFHSAIESEREKGREIIVIDAHLSPDSMIEEALPSIKDKLDRKR